MQTQPDAGHHDELEPAPGARRDGAAGPPRFWADVEEISDGTVVRPHGELDHSRTAQFRRTIAHARLCRPARLVVDLSEVPELCGAAVATLVEAQRDANRDGSLLVLCGLRGRTRSLFEIVRLDRSVFTIVETVDQAVGLPNRRRSGRFPRPSVRSDRGTVLDISAGGLKLRSERKLRGRLSLRLWNEQTDLVLEGRVIRSQRVGPRHYEAGLQFINLGAEAARKLAAILRVVRESFQPRLEPLVP